MKSGFLDNARKPTTPNFLTALDSGCLDLASMLPFPEQDEQESCTGDAWVAEISALLEEWVDAAEIDLTGELPAGLFDEFAKWGYFKLHIGPELGGLKLAPYTHFRFIERIASVSVGLAQSVSLSNNMSPVLLLPVLPPGPLRDFVRERVNIGIIGGFADTGPSGQNNQFPDLTATLSEDGSTYLLNGEKCLISNGPVADLLCVTVTILDCEPRKTGIAFVDTRLPGFSVTSKIEFMGLKGVPNGALAFDNVRVPREYVLDVQGDPQLAQSISTAVLIGRMFVVSALATGVARRCLGWTRDFVTRRSIDGRRLGYYDEIQRMLATTLAEVYAMDTVAKWCLLNPHPQDRWFELLVTKNISTITAWRIVDRTMSLMGGQGYETESSKRRRGVQPIPLERAFRDLRGLRITANVDFQLDNQAAWLLISRYYHQPDPLENGAPLFDEDVGDIHLSPANCAHLEVATAQVREFRMVCQELVEKYPDPQVLARKEHMLILLSRIATELFTMCAVLARTITKASTDSSTCQDLADVFCTDARDRLAQLWRQLTVDYDPNHARLSQAWLTGSELDYLIKH